MESITIGAVGAAAIAALASLYGLIVSKEQKVSEFRQAWINDLRACLVLYLAELNAIVDIVRLTAADKLSDTSELVKTYRSLNSATNGIKLRLNTKERTSIKLLGVMKRFEGAAKTNCGLTPEIISPIEEEFLKASEELLKFEWKRVKKGEFAFRLTKYLVGGSALVIVALLVASYLFVERIDKEPEFPLPGVYSVAN